MALFSRNPKKETKAKKSSAAATPRTKTREATTAIRARAAVALTAPWISEKALIGTEKGVYVFAVSHVATKGDIARAIETVYKVVPRSVRIVNLPGKRVSRRTTSGVALRPRRRKAYVYLKKGDTIQFA
ncbi:MAG: 50S ribosomal protein L23 [Parcubacteria group bacterium 21-54-25]|nr:MAG: 50S ribosomal protein L23 [Parcubacteria group bacterium 21-54-25]HQU07888.1 50S ribosomal protein L23 [Candidatus Paceibacterota bacterium]